LGLKNLWLTLASILDVLGRLKCDDSRFITLDLDLEPADEKLKVKNLSNPDLSIYDTLYQDSWRYLMTNCTSSLLGSLILIKIASCLAIETHAI
jgi:hypothetical protein